VLGTWEGIEGCRFSCFADLFGFGCGRGNSWGAHNAAWPECIAGCAETCGDGLFLEYVLA